MAVKRRVPVVEEEEEEEAPTPRKKRASEQAMEDTVVERKAIKARTNGTAAVPAKRQPPRREGPSARDYVTKVLLKGSPRNEVKKRAAALAKKDGADVSFKTFDVSYFIRYLRDEKGYKIRESDDGMVKATAPVEA